MPKITEPKQTSSIDLEEEKRLKIDTKPEANKVKMSDRVSLIKKSIRDAIFREKAQKAAIDEQFNEGDDDLPERVRHNKLYKISYLISSHFVFGTVIILLIVTNTVVLALDRYPIDQDEFETLGKDALN